MQDTNNIYIGRKHPILGNRHFGNRYRVKVYGRRLALSLYSKNIILSADQIDTLRNARELGCWCEKTDQCHGDILLSFL